MGSYTLSVTTDCTPVEAAYLLDKIADLLDDYGYPSLRGSARPEEDEALYDIDAYGNLMETNYDELCSRCLGVMFWLHGSFICSVCHYKPGCCEGEPQS